MFIDGGIDSATLETFDLLGGLEVGTHAVWRLAEVSMTAQMSTSEDGRSRDGVPPEQCAKRLPGPGHHVGVNCGARTAATLETLEGMADRSSVPLSARPNAGGREWSADAACGCLPFRRRRAIVARVPSRTLVLTKHPATPSRDPDGQPTATRSPSSCR